MLPALKQPLAVNIKPARIFDIFICVWRIRPEREAAYGVLIVFAWAGSLSVSCAAASVMFSIKRISV